MDHWTRRKQSRATAFREYSQMRDRHGAGHKTPSIFQRYNIVSDGDLASAARMLDGIGGVAIRATP